MPLTSGSAPLRTDSGPQHSTFIQTMATVQPTNFASTPKSQEMGSLEGVASSGHGDGSLIHAQAYSDL